ncbi:hypothetical protein WCP94_000928 [Bilophila wadsworthia]
MATGGNGAGRFSIKNRIKKGGKEHFSSLFRPLDRAAGTALPQKGF